MDFLHFYLYFSVLVFAASLATDVIDQRILAKDKGAYFRDKPEKIGVVRITAHAFLSFIPGINILTAAMVLFYNLSAL